MGQVKSYKDLEIYLLSKKLAVRVHKMTLDDLPKFEMFEEGSQIRRSSKSIVSNIVEGYGRRRYKNEFVRFLTYAVGSCDETKAHLEMLYETGSLDKQNIFEQLIKDYEEVGSKLFRFREAVIKGHRSS
ncbi:MAG: four helix bundle protein [Desulfobacteraceae bacterium]|uniref:Four helix bundle protein n=1 Tax=Candidatus Desulfacyla euxinica TaxID=2841693 RepID=A0A8J6TA04_9DELT|nr:four helix bundle protein [Candidatus Desulfacyla euxinica]MBL6977429.1 four helix bundle protein [Desulfobacteraceae bacterium]MBL7216531.1 four helix bundle protein [Desulfobacteraceae bacterium]